MDQPLELDYCELVEPLTSLTATVVVDIYPGNLFFVEQSCYEVARGRPVIWQVSPDGDSVGE